MEARRLQGLDLNLLVVLDALLTERSVTVAARRLSMTQPGVSSALKRLRSIFDDELLVREGRLMRATPFAEALVQPTARAVAEVEGVFWSRPAFDPDMDSRTFTVLAADYPTLVLLRPFAIALAATAPGVRLRLEGLPIEDYAEPLNAGSADFAVIPRFISETLALPFSELFRDEYVGTTWRGNDSVGARIGLTELRDSPFLGFEQGGHRSVAAARLAELGVGQPPDVVIGSFVTGALFLRGTRFVTFLQRRLVRELEGAAELKIFDSPVEAPALIEDLVWHPRREDDAAHTWLRDRLVTFANEL